MAPRASVRCMSRFVVQLTFTDNDRRLAARPEHRTQVREWTPILP